MSQQKKAIIHTLQTCNLVAMALMFGAMVCGVLFHFTKQVFYSDLCLIIFLVSFSAVCDFFVIISFLQKQFQASVDQEHPYQTESVKRSEAPGPFWGMLILLTSLSGGALFLAIWKAVQLLGS